MAVKKKVFASGQDIIEAVDALLVLVRSKPVLRKFFDKSIRDLEGLKARIGNQDTRVAIIGITSSGKSTLMNIIGCLDTPTSGDYWLSGRHIAVQSEATLAKIRSKEIGFIFQSFYLLQRQTAFENVELPLIYSGMSEKERKKRVREVLERVQLADKMDHYPNQLSGGQQQRVAIARAVANNPTILLADEPTGALDQNTGRQVMELFHSLNEEGRTIIMITHDSKIAAHAQRIVRILDGNISAGGLEDA